MRKEENNRALEKKQLLQELIDDGCNTSSKLLAKLCEKRKISARESIRFLELSFEEQVEAYMEYCLNTSF